MGGYGRLYGEEEAEYDPKLVSENHDLVREKSGNFISSGLIAVLSILLKEYRAYRSVAVGIQGLSQCCCRNTGLIAVLL
ncbi:hypothetical protein DPMN_126008 [Dreissena polymorpha]|uniref:Uncharacterized protein n=1 Tax=Dreissena polymorpha TaxID=45954 RepID=A0A9D4JXQ8_DREPO|nr:hypothetical protein DPMN_126008 [Dreissena polymorpha]